MLAISAKIKYLQRLDITFLAFIRILINTTLYVNVY